MQSFSYTAQSSDRFGKFSTNISIRAISAALNIISSLIDDFIFFYAQWQVKTSPHTIKSVPPSFVSVSQGQSQNDKLK